MRIYQDLCTGSPGVASWTKLYTTFMNREGTAFKGEETKTTYVSGVRGQRLLHAKKDI